MFGNRERDHPTSGNAESLVNLFNTSVLRPTRTGGIAMTHDDGTTSLTSPLPRRSPPRSISTASLNCELFGEMERLRALL